MSLANEQGVTEKPYAGEVMKKLKDGLRAGDNRHSDKEKLRSDLNRSESCEISEWLLKTLWKSEDFQAEYTPSISNSSFSIWALKTMEVVNLTMARGVDARPVARLA